MFFSRKKLQEIRKIFILQPLDLIGSPFAVLECNDSKILTQTRWSRSDRPKSEFPRCISRTRREAHDSFPTQFDSVRERCVDIWGGPVRDDSLVWSTHQTNYDFETYFRFLIPFLIFFLLFFVVWVFVFVFWIHFILRIVTRIVMFWLRIKIQLSDPYCRLPWSNY